MNRVIPIFARNQGENMRRILSALLVSGLSIGSASAGFAAVGENHGSDPVLLAQYDPGYYRDRDRDRYKYRHDHDRDRDRFRRCRTSMVKNNGVWHRVTQCY